MVVQQHLGGAAYLLAGGGRAAAVGSDGSTGRPCGPILAPHPRETTRSRDDARVHQPRRDRRRRRRGARQQRLARRSTRTASTRFADATGDHQWIHVDVERAAAGPFGGTIAHGYLTLSLLPVLGSQVFALETPGAKLNYGVNKVRFPTRSRSARGSAATATVVEVTDLPAGKQLTLGYTIEIEGAAQARLRRRDRRPAAAVSRLSSATGRLTSTGLDVSDGSPDRAGQPIRSMTSGVGVYAAPCGAMS